MVWKILCGQCLVICSRFDQGVVPFEFIDQSLSAQFVALSGALIMPQPRLRCPFQGCTGKYVDKSRLGRHLRDIEHDSNDTLHKDEAVKAEAKANGLYEFHARNLPDEVKKQRRLDSRKRTYEKNKANQLKKHRKDRMKRRRVLVNLFGSVPKLKEHVEEVRRTVKLAKANERLRQKAIDKVWKKRASLSEFVFDTVDPSEFKVTVDTFARFVVYFLPPTQLPSPGQERKSIIEQIAQNTHFRRVSLCLHSDQNDDPLLAEMMKLFSDSYVSHWKEIVEDRSMRKVKLWRDGEEEEFRAEGPSHEWLADLYIAYLEAFWRASDFHDKVKDLSIWEVWLITTPSSNSGMLEICDWITSFPELKDVLGKIIYTERCSADDGSDSGS